MTATPGQGAKFKAWLAGLGVLATNLQAATVEALLEEEDLPPQARRALELKAGLSKSSLAKYPKILATANSLGVVREILVYHRAHTGRFGGRGVQIQNLARPLVLMSLVVTCLISCSYDTFKFFYDDLAIALSSMLRAVIIPRDGKKFLIADFAQMEARVLAWLAGDDERLRLFAAGEDLYCYNASKLYNRTITKEDKDERFVGKVSDLSSGYQGGIAAIVRFAKTYRLKLKPLVSIILPGATEKELESAEWSYLNTYLPQCKRDKVKPVDKDIAFVADVLKQRWRKENSTIVQFWGDLEVAAIEAVQTQLPVKIRNLTWFVNGQFLYCRLPSERCMAYPYPQLNKSGKLTYMFDDVQLGWIRVSTYGGKLAENITQAVQRDLLTDGILRIDPVYEIAFHVHDELIAEVPEEHDCLADFVERMKVVPTWAEGVPIDVEGWEGKRYGKAA